MRHAHSSEYMQWAKMHAHAQYHLGASGVANYPLAELPVSLGELEITGDSYYGYGPLQSEIAAYAGVTQERVFASLGTSLANHMAMAAVLEDGDRVLIEEPTYELLVSNALYLGADVVRFPRRADRDFAVDPAEIERRITPGTKLVVLTNLHNPTSAYTGEETLLRVAGLARKVGAKVLVDEVYLDAYSVERPRSSALLGDDFIVTSSLTKVYGLSGLRCGWVLAGPPLVKKMWLLKDLFENIPPHISELLSVVAFRHLDRIRMKSESFMEANRKTMRDRLLSRGEIECFDPGFGTVLFPRMKAGGVDVVAERLLGEYDTIITPGRFFGMSDHFRIGLGGKPEMFSEGMRRFCDLLDRLRKDR